MAVKVSICIPAYNQTEYLIKNLESILTQTYLDYEIIISDDSNNSNVELLVNKFFENKTCKFIYHKNKSALGSPANWNKAISLATGEYIKIMHHDDWFESTESLRKFVKILDENPATNFVFCSSQVYDVQTKLSKLNKPESQFLENLKKDRTIIFNNNLIGSPSAVIYRASTKLNFDERLTYLVDVDFYLRMLQLNNNFQFIDEPLIVNSCNLPSQVTSSSINKKIQIGEYCYLYNKTFSGKFPQKRYRIFFKEIFAWYKVNSLKEIRELGYETPKPEWIFWWLIFKAKFFNA